MKTGRNDPCPCGSGRKYKKCCLDKPPKLVGGAKLPEGMVLGPIMFSKDGKPPKSLIMQPAIQVFDFAVANRINRLPHIKLEVEEIQTEFNSLVGDLVAETLLYFQNRLKPIVQKGAGQMQSFKDVVNSYQAAGIDLTSLCDTIFLECLINVRGSKTHTDQRYNDDRTIAGVSYNTSEDLRGLALKVRELISDLDKKLGETHPDFEVKMIQDGNKVGIEMQAINHAYNLNKGGRVVPKKSKPPSSES